ncbi:FmdB family zinc ribbon protein [Actinokineospora sp. G85]|uniref:FmdB family zinc ribbon protein n=1 Tax=Actinokineospora sp. G85 TaxID=3406626 RepID=UPI003C70CC3B
MPTYQYACTACEHRFEAVQSFSDSSLTECPECAGKLRKLYGSVGVVFKGSGFYRNDSRSSSSSTTPAADAAKPAETSATPSTASTATKSSDSAGSGSSASTSSGSSTSTATASPAKAS